MEIIGETLSHTKYGKGVVTNKEDKIITVIFQAGEKKFHFPEAFEKHLIFKSEKKQQLIHELVDELVKKREEQEMAAMQKKEQQERLLSLKVQPNSQAVFGFIANEKEQVFSTWTLSTGTYLSGKSKGQPRIPSKMQINSACLLTECPKREPEENRRIIGAFMVKDTFEGAQCLDGKIQSHEKYRIRLTPSEELLFWNYFADDEKKNRWGTSEIKYFSNKTMQKILQDMTAAAASREQQMALEDFYQYFLKINKLTD